MLQIAQPDAGSQDIHLPAGVVDVIFAVDPVARSLPANWRRWRRTPRRGRGRRAAGRWGWRRRTPPVPAGRRQARSDRNRPAVRDLAHRCLVGGGRQKEIDETGSAMSTLATWADGVEFTAMRSASSRGLRRAVLARGQRNGAGRNRRACGRGCVPAESRMDRHRPAPLPLELLERLGDEVVQMRFSRGKPHGVFRLTDHPSLKW